MSGYQFVRMAAYAMVVPKLHARAQEQRRELGEKEVERKLSVEEICFEAGRVPGNHPHVVEAQAPTLLFGMAPEAIPQWLQERIDEKNEEIAAIKQALPRGQRRSGPRAIRKDTPVLLGIVGSHPFLVRSDGSDQPSMEDPENRALVDQWVEDWLAWKIADAAERGATLVSVVAHTDEAHYHLHAFEIAGDLRLDARQAHPGYAAKRAVEPLEGESDTDTAGRRNRAFRDAMVRWQDEHHRAVGAPNGLLRVGPRRRRLCRPAYLREKKAAEGVARIRAAERAEETRARAVADQRDVEERKSADRLHEIRAEADELERRSKGAQAEAEAAEKLRAARATEAEQITSRAEDLIIDLSERKRQLEEAMAVEDDRLRRAREACASLKEARQREEAAIATVRAGASQAAAEKEAAIQERNDAQRNAADLLERLQLWMQSERIGAAMVAQKEAQRTSLEAEIRDLEARTKEEEALRLRREKADAVARLALDQRETDIFTREKANREEEFELEGKLTGIDAYLDGRLRFRGDAENLKLRPAAPDQALLEKVKPVPAWLSERLLPIERTRRKATAYLWAATAWAKGWLTSHRNGPGGYPVLQVVKTLDPVVKTLIDEHNADVVKLLSRLPDARDLMELAERARRLLPHLDEAEAAEARVFQQELAKCNSQGNPGGRG